MSKPWIAALTALAGFGWGLAAGTAQVFPYRQIVAAKQLVAPAPPQDKPRYSILAAFPAHRRTLFIGDSIAEEPEWADVFPGASVANWGVRGDTSRDVRRRLAGALAIRPEVVIITAGLNDPGAGVTLAETRANYRAMAAAVRAAGAEPVILAPPIPADDELAAFILELRPSLSEHGAVVDANAALGADGIRPEYSADGLHPNGAGYRVLARHLRPFVR